MIIFATGISGSGRLEYLREVERLSGGSVKVIDVGELMFEKSRHLGIEIPEGKILDLDVFALNYLRAVTFEEILKIRDRYRDGTDLIISTHTCFRWKKHLIPAFNFYYLNQLDPDMYINIVDSAHHIKARLEAGKWAGRLSLKEILIWRDEEAFTTSMLAEYQRKPFYIIPRNEPPELLLRIIRDVEGRARRGERPALKAYLSYPMTYLISAEPKWLEEKDRVKEALSRAGVVVFDPMSVEEMDLVGMAENAKDKGSDSIEFDFEGRSFSLSVGEVEEAIEDIKDQTVARDYKLIDQCDVIIVFYPVTTFSPGVLNEIHYGFTHNKEVYAIFPYKQKSPFFLYYTTRIFTGVEELIDYLRESGRI